MALSHCPAWCPHSSSNLRVVANSEKKLGAHPGDVDAVGQGWTRVRLWGLSPHPQLLLLPCSLTPGLSLGGLHGCPPELLPALRWGSWDSEPGLARGHSRVALERSWGGLCGGPERVHALGWGLGWVALSHAPQLPRSFPVCKVGREWLRWWDTGPPKGLHGRG